MKRKPKRKLRAMALRINSLERSRDVVLAEVADLFAICEQLSLRLTEVEQPMEEPNDER